MKKYKSTLLLLCLQLGVLSVGHSTGARARPKTEIEIFAEQAQAVKAANPLQIANMMTAAEAERSFYATQIIQMGSYGGRDAYRLSRDQYERDLSLLHERFDFARAKLDVLQKI